MNILTKLISIFSKNENKIECEKDDYCPIYLSYLNKYENIDHSKLTYCKNSNKQFCTKYRLLNENEWKKIDKSEKIEIIKNMYLIDFIEKEEK